MRCGWVLGPNWVTSRLPFDYGSECSISQTVRVLCYKAIRNSLSGCTCCPFCLLECGGYSESWGPRWSYGRIRQTGVSGTVTIVVLSYAVRSRLSWSKGLGTGREQKSSLLDPRVFFYHLLVSCGCPFVVERGFNGPGPQACGGSMISRSE